MGMLFSVIAGLLVLAALLFVLPPLLRDPARRRLRLLREARDAGVLNDDDYQRRARAAVDQDDGHSRRGLAAALGVLIAVATTGLYLQLGTPAGIDPDRSPATAEGAAPHTVEEAVAELRARIEADPQDLQSHMMLGLALKSTNRFEEAIEVLRQAQTLAPDSAQIQTELAEALILDNRGNAAPARAAELLQQAVQTQPQNQKALWLLGAIAMQSGQAERAVSHWERLLPLIDDDSVRASVQQQIDNARSQLAASPAAPMPDATTPERSSASTPSTESAAPAANAVAEDRDNSGLEFTVDLAPELRDSVPGQAVLFVFARPADGSRMPLAAQRLTGFEFPVRVQLNDSDSMIASRKLSDHRRVMLVARISSSGGAIARPGDLEGNIGPVERTGAKTPRVVIDRVIGAE